MPIEREFDREIYIFGILPCLNTIALDTCHAYKDMHTHCGGLAQRSSAGYTQPSVRHTNCSTPSFPQSERDLGIKTC